MKFNFDVGPWESMRTPEEEAQDQDREAHLGGYCTPDCSICREERDQARAQACADAFQYLANSAFTHLFRAKK